MNEVDCLGGNLRPVLWVIFNFSGNYFIDKVLKAIANQVISDAKGRKRLQFGLKGLVAA